MARKVSTSRKLGTTIFAGLIGFLLFFPVLWILVLSFKSELDAVRSPMQILSSSWTFDSYDAVMARSDYFKHFYNSVVISCGSTLLGLLVAVPAAWAMAFVPGKRTKDVLLWMLSTKMLPPVGVLVPIYLLFRDMGLLDTRIGLVIVIMLINLPIIIWMLYMAVPGIASTVLLNIILAWNEAFWTLNLTASNAAPLTAFIASYSSPEGLFYAKLSAASVMAIAPILIMGWFSQKQLVRGLTFGAVK